MKPIYLYIIRLFVYFCLAVFITILSNSFVEKGRQLISSNLELHEGLNVVFKSEKLGTEVKEDIYSKLTAFDVATGRVAQLAELSQDLKILSWLVIGLLIVLETWKSVLSKRFKQSRVV